MTTRVLPGPDGRYILAKWSEIGGVSLTWRDTGELIQHRIYNMYEIFECLSGTLPESVREEVHETALAGARPEPNRAEGGDIVPLRHRKFEATR